MTTPTESHLIAQAIGGDRIALQKLLCAHYDRLFDHIRFKLDDGERISAEDILQETLVHVVRDVGTCQAQTRASFSAWLKSVADNRIRDAQKKFQRLKHGGGRKQVIAAKSTDADSYANLLDVLSDSTESPSAGAARFEAVRAIHVGLANLPEDQRTAVTVRYIQGQSLEEAARTMKKTPAAVRGLLHRAKVALRDELGRSSLWFSKR